MLQINATSLGLSCMITESACLRCALHFTQSAASLKLNFASCKSLVTLANVFLVVLAGDFLHLILELFLLESSSCCMCPSYHRHDVHIFLGSLATPKAAHTSSSVTWPSLVQPTEWPHILISRVWKDCTCFFVQHSVPFNW